MRRGNWEGSARAPWEEGLIPASASGSRQNVRDRFEKAGGGAVNQFGWGGEPQSSLLEDVKQFSCMMKVSVSQTAFSPTSYSLLPPGLPLTLVDLASSFWGCGLIVGLLGPSLPAPSRVLKVQFRAGREYLPNSSPCTIGKSNSAFKSCWDGFYIPPWIPLGTGTASQT